MPERNPITVNGKASDGTDVPLIYTPDQVERDRTTFVCKLGVPISDPYLKLGLRRPVKGSRVYKQQADIVIPRTIVSDGVETVDRTDEAHLTMYFSERSTTAERLDLCERHRSFVNSSAFVEMATKTEGFW